MGGLRVLRVFYAKYHSDANITVTQISHRHKYHTDKQPLSNNLIQNDGTSHVWQTKLSCEHKLDLLDITLDSLETKAK